MPLTTLLKMTKKFEIEVFREPKAVEELRLSHVAFSGSPQKHPYDPERIILVSDPYSGNTQYYEFRTEDISHVEELPHIVNLDNEVITMVRIWVKKMSLAIRSSPFLVADLG